jgi:hypothetical protein
MARTQSPPVDLAGSSEPVEGQASDLRGAATPSPSQPEAEAVFIVGVSRSGTTLMRKVLGSHSRIAVAAENHFLGHLLPWEGARVYLRRAGDLRDDAAVRRLVELVYAGRLQRPTWLREPSPYWRWLTRSVPRADLETRLLVAERSERGVFSTLLRTYADRRHKAIMGEKTPAHVGWADTLLGWYPGGRIVHMVRDPRAVYVSELRRRLEHPVSVPYRWLVHVPLLMRVFVLHEVAWAWAGAVRHHRDLSRRYPGAYRMVRFEDLVRDPDATITGVCDFLGVAMEPALLRQRVVSKGSRVGERGFDAGAAERWRSTIGRGAERWLRVLLGGRLAELGYDDGSRRSA